MSFGKRHQKIPPDSPSLRVRTPSKSHSTPLTRESFNEMLAIAWPLISKKDTHLRSALKVSERLSVTAISCDRFVFFTLVFVHLVDNIANILSLSIIANCKL